jgi:hypothetical protein
VTLKDRVKITEDVVYRTVGEGTVVINAETDSYHVLDPVGSRVWELLRTHGRLQQVLDSLREEYDVDSEVLHQDILYLIQELQAVGLVEVVSPNAA